MSTLRAFPLFMLYVIKHNLISNFNTCKNIINMFTFDHKVRIKILYR